MSVELRRVDGRSVRKTLSERISEAASGSVVYVSPVEVEGAKLRVKADHELGRPTPDWIHGRTDRLMPFPTAFGRSHGIVRAAVPRSR